MSDTRMIHQQATDQVGAQLDLAIGPWQRRNWSRVASASTPDGRRWFLKQFIDARGQRLTELFTAERAAASLLNDRRSSMQALRLIEPTASLPEQLILIYPHVEFQRLDDALDATLDAALERAAGAATTSSLGALLATAVDDLVSLAAPPGGPSLRPGRCTLGPVMLAWRGLDVKNLGVHTSHHQSSDGVQRALELFDLGPAYRAHACEPVARLVASGLVAHFGSPVRRSLAGIPEWADEVLGPLAQRTCAGELHRRLDKSLAVRVGGIQPTTFARRLLATPTARLLSGRYWREAHRWVDEHAPTHDQLSPHLEEQ